VTHVATNGAGSIHDWEFAYLGMSTEDVRANTAAGRFGTWDETGRYIGLALATGAAAGLGYGASVGRMISSSGLDLPTRSELLRRADAALADEGEGAADTAAAIADLIAVMAVAKTIPGRLTVRHPHEQYSIQAAAWQAGIPFTVHPGIGYDIIYTHPLVSGGAVGRCALRDFLTYAGSVLRLSGGVHLTVGSSVMGPMIFEKALSMANNHLCSGAGEPVHDHYLAVVDIQDGGDWDWRSGEPPMAHPAYYLRFCKTFVRMGGTLDYLCMDNRQFLLALCAELGSAPRSAIE
jgi:hypothetical protein